MNATAYVVAPPDGSGATMMDIARALGFRAVLPYGGIGAAEHQAAATPILFFLFAAVRVPRQLRPMAEAIRASNVREVRFSPLIYFTDTPSLDVIKQCIGIGFDDVITQPFTAARIEQRLSRQLDQTLVYFETDTYVGPDRRGRLPEAEDQHHQRGTGGQHRRIEIIRSLIEGVSVLGDDEQIVL